MPNSIEEIARGLTELDRSLLLGTAEGWGSWMWDSASHMVSLGLGTHRDGSIVFDTPLADALRTHLQSRQP